MLSRDSCPFFSEACFETSMRSATVIAKTSVDAATVGREARRSAAPFWYISGAA